MWRSLLMSEEQSSSSDDQDVLRSASERQHAVPNTKKMKPASSSAIPELSSSESTTRKRRGRGNNGNREQPKSPKDVKAETKQRTRKGKSEEFKGSTGWARFSPFRFFSMIFIWFVNCVAGSNENPVENLEMRASGYSLILLPQCSLDFGGILQDSRIGQFFCPGQQSLHLEYF